MEINQHPETWTHYIDRMVAADPWLEGDAFEDLMMDLISESTVLEIEGCDDPTRHKRVIQLAETLIEEVWQKSKSSAAPTEGGGPCSPPLSR